MAVLIPCGWRFVDYSGVLSGPVILMLHTFIFCSLNAAPQCQSTKVTWFLGVFPPRAASSAFGTGDRRPCPKQPCPLTLNLARGVAGPQGGMS